MEQWFFKITGEGSKFKVQGSKKGNVVIIHGCRSNKESEERKKDHPEESWKEWIREKLNNSDIKTTYPHFPESWNPKYDTWAKIIEKEYITNQTTIVAHSCGAAFIVKWLGETKKRIKKLILVAPAKIPKTGDTSKSELFDFEIDPIIRENIQEIVCFLSNDKQRHLDAAQLYQDAIGGQFVHIKNKGHFTFDEMNTNEFPELLHAIIDSSLYPERLLNNLSKLDWPEPIKLMQKNWIGRSEGIDIEYEVEGIDSKISCFTTRPDTNFGATFITLAPDSDFVEKNIDKFPEKEKVQKYIKESSKKTELERIDAKGTKTGVFTGLYAINQLNNRNMPVYVGDFVLASIGTGAVVGVPGHDIRDFEFAKAMDLEIIRVVVGSDGDESKITTPEQVQEEEGIMVNSDFLDGLDIHKATVKVMDYLEEKGYGKRVVNYKLRDWLISRQRYWGAPIPIIYCDDCGEVPVPEKDLPVELPDDVDFRPKGKSPLERSKSFHNVKCPKCQPEAGQPLADKSKARRESDTMDTFVDSSWYFLRYIDAKNKKEFASKKKLKTWMSVDTYVGGAEHAVMHLMYARFFCMVLYDLDLLSFEEPFLKLRNQGLILGPDGHKMSKSRGNVINPDDVIEQLGADTMRMYEMFMGPLEEDKPWNTDGIIGVRRFLERVWNMSEKVQGSRYKVQDEEKKIERELHYLIKKVGEDIESFGFNTAVSQFMIFVNTVYKAGEISKRHFEIFLTLLNPFAPHITNELWEMIGKNQLIEKEKWPKYNEKFLVEEKVTYVIQVNGKVRANIVASPKAKEDEVADLSKKDQKVASYLKGGEVIKQIFVPSKLINFVVK